MANRFLHGLRSKHSEIMCGTIHQAKTSTTLMAQSYSFDKIFDDKFEDLRLDVVDDIAINFTFQCFSACGFVDVNL
jgi:hypothetical protein